MKKVAVFLPNWVGDAVMATPTLRALRTGLGRNVSLIGIGKPAVTAVLEGNTWLNELWTFKPRSSAKFPGRRAITWRMRKEKIDTAILMPNSLAVAVMGWLGGARHRIGYARDGRSAFLTQRLQAPRSGRRWRAIPAVDYYLGLADALGCLTHDRHMELSLTSHDKQQYLNLLTQWNWDPSKPTIVINNGGAYGGAKLWPQENVTQLAQRLASEKNQQVLLHCGPDEKEAANQTANQINSPLVRSMGTLDSLPLGLSKAVLAKASVVISTDSGPRHIAVAFNRPVISLFGPTDVAWTTTYNIAESVMEEQLPCRACWKRECPLGHHRCMTDIKVEKIYHETLRRLQEPGVSPANHQSRYVA